MWPFKRKKTAQPNESLSPQCPGCGSRDTKLVIHNSSGSPEYVKVWRGRRSLTYRCSECGNDFYADEPPGGASDESVSGNGLIDDEQAFRAAEEELKRQTDQEDDRRYK
jgi:DNA-directed RNA polymerase subunit RPC12/RpoP